MEFKIELSLSIENLYKKLNDSNDSNSNESLYEDYKIFDNLRGEYTKIITSVQNNGINKFKYLGLEWKIEQIEQYFSSKGINGDQYARYLGINNDTYYWT